MIALQPGQIADFQAPAVDQQGDDKVSFGQKARERPSLLGLSQKPGPEFGDILAGSGAGNVQEFGTGGEFSHQIGSKNALFHQKVKKDAQTLNAPPVTVYVFIAALEIVSIAFDIGGVEAAKIPLILPIGQKLIKTVEVCAVILESVPAQAPDRTPLKKFFPSPLKIGDFHNFNRLDQFLGLAKACPHLLQSNIMLNQHISSFPLPFEEKALLRELRRWSLDSLDPKLLFEALAHKSWANEVAGWPHPCNERLEFLGDAVLGAWCSHKLFSLFKNLDEGKLSRLRGSIVGQETLGQWGRLLKLDQFLLVGKGERARGLHKSDGIVSDLFEALLGASFVGLGWEHTYKALDCWEELFREHSGQELFDCQRLRSFDPKSRLQEKSMAVLKELPEYVAEEVGQGFKVSLKLGGKTLAGLIASSKKKAEKALAEKALAHNWIEELGSEVK